MSPDFAKIISRLGAIALLAGVLATIYGYAVGPLLAGYSEVDRAIAEADERIERYQRIAASHDIYQSELDKLADRQSVSGIYLGGATDALAGAELQYIVSAAVESGGGLLRSVQILPAKTDSEFRRVSVRVQMTAAIAQLAGILYALEAGKTFLFVDNLEISNRRSRARRNQPVDMDPTLLVRLDLSGYLKPEAE